MSDFTTRVDHCSLSLSYESKIMAQVYLSAAAWLPIGLSSIECDLIYNYTL